jgi:hypothetical protein
MKKVLLVMVASMVVAFGAFAMEESGGLGPTSTVAGLAVATAGDSGTALETENRFVNVGRTGFPSSPEELRALAESGKILVFSIGFSNTNPAVKSLYETLKTGLAELLPNQLFPSLQADWLIGNPKILSTTPQSYTDEEKETLFQEYQKTMNEWYVQVTDETPHDLSAIRPSWASNLTTIAILCAKGEGEISEHIGEFFRVNFLSVYVPKRPGDSLKDILAQLGDYSSYKINLYPITSSNGSVVIDAGEYNNPFGGSGCLTIERYPITLTGFNIHRRLDITYPPAIDLNTITLNTSYQPPTLAPFPMLTLDISCGKRLVNVNNWQSLPLKEFKTLTESGKILVFLMEEATAALQSLYDRLLENGLAELSRDLLFPGVPADRFRKNPKFLGKSSGDYDEEERKTLFQDYQFATGQYGLLTIDLPPIKLSSDALVSLRKLPLDKLKELGLEWVTRPNLSADSEDTSTSREISVDELMSLGSLKLLPVDSLKEWGLGMFAEGVLAGISSSTTSGDASGPFTGGASAVDAPSATAASTSGALTAAVAGEEAEETDSSKRD